ncbi:MAG: hypothetical protein K2H47_08920 [Muribaculaceae bacterium]|nr:hypothetical protein [Muribaculaceae bacterium]
MSRQALYIILLLVAACLGQSCRSSENLDMPNPDNADPEVTLCLMVEINNSADINRPATRADDYTFEGPASIYERINSLRVIIVRPDNTVEYNRFESLDKNEGVQKFGELIFQVSISQGNLDDSTGIRTEKKRIYLIANEESLQPEELLTTLKNLEPGNKFSSKTAEEMIISTDWEKGITPLINNTEEHKKFVPMSEFFDVDVSATIKAGASRPIQYKSLFITRASVKFEFSVSAESSADLPGESFRIQTIRFEKLMPEEYLFPHATEYTPGKYVDNVINRAITAFETPSLSGGKTGAIEFHPSDFGCGTNNNGEAYADEYKPQLYYCESKSDRGIDGNPSYAVGVIAEFSNPPLPLTGEIVTDTVKFNPVELPNLPILPRNTVVKVHFTFKDRTPKCSVTLHPYTAVTLNPSFGFSNSN